MKTAFLIVKL